MDLDTRVTFNWHAFERNPAKLFTDRRDDVQRKTFTRWINKHLAFNGVATIADLYQDLRDGTKLITLLKILSNDESLHRERGHSRLHHRQNAQIVLNYLADKCGVKLVNIRPEDLVDGNEKLTLGLVWSIVQYFQLTRPDQDKERLLEWAQHCTGKYSSRVHIRDFTQSWCNGLAFCALLNNYHPERLNFDAECLQEGSGGPRENLERAFSLAEALGVTRLLDAEDVDCATPDERSLLTYIAMLYECLERERTTEPNGYSSD